MSNDGKVVVVVRQIGSPLRRVLGIGLRGNKGFSLGPKEGEIGKDLPRPEVDGCGVLGLVGNDLFKFLGRG